MSLGMGIDSGTGGIGGSWDVRHDAHAESDVSAYIPMQSVMPAAASQQVRLTTDPSSVSLPTDMFVHPVEPSHDYEELDEVTKIYMGCTLINYYFLFYRFFCFLFRSLSLFFSVFVCVCVLQDIYEYRPGTGIPNLPTIEPDHKYDDARPRSGNYAASKD